jgi:predicted MFS family arabinose efflux permease
MPATQLRLLIAAEGVSNFGGMLTRLAVPWIASLALAATPAQMAMLVVADMVAGAVGALWLGPWIDRLPKRRAMLVCDGARAVLLALLAALAWGGAISMAVLVAAALAAGVFNVAFALARSAWIAQRVPAPELARANAGLAAAGSVSETLAFASGGWLYQWAGAVWALLVDACSFVASAVLLRGVQEAPPAGTSLSAASAWRRWWGEQREGWRSLLAHPVLRALTAVEALRAVGMGLVGTSYMVFVSRDLGLATGAQGLLFALGALGALAGAAVAPRLPPATGLVCGLGLAALGALCVPLAYGAGWAAMALIAAQQIVGDAGDTVVDVHDHTLRQSLAPPDQLARVDAGIRSVGQLGALLGALLGGVWGTWQSPRAVLFGGAALFACAALCAGLGLGRRMAARVRA